MVTYAKPQQGKKEESERLTGERDQIKLLILDLKDGRLQDSGKLKESKRFHKLHVLWSFGVVSWSSLLSAVSCGSLINFVALAYISDFVWVLFLL